MKLLKKQAEVEIPKDLEKRVIETYKKLAVKRWTEKSLEKENAERVLYNIIYRETKGKNIPITFKEIYEYVDKALPKVIEIKKPKKEETSGQGALEKAKPTIPDTEVHLEREGRVVFQGKFEGYDTRAILFPKTATLVIDSESEGDRGTEVLDLTDTYLDELHQYVGPRGAGKILKSAQYTTNAEGKLVPEK